jgi:LysR family transcriptional regulator, transcriptional activator of nhaA
MEWLNYHHLLYFWTVAREGTVSAAGKTLRLSQPTISTQLRALEDQLGQPLFDRSRRRLVLTEAGRVVFRYADEIFGLGREMLDVLKDRPSGRALELTVGLTFVVAKLVAHRLLRPAFELAEGIRVHVHEDRLPALLVRLANHELDMVVSDAPIGAESNIRAFNHPLGQCGVTFFGAAALASKYRRGFPKSLDGAPMLLPLAGSILRRDLERWLSRVQVSPNVVGDFDDSALLKVFGQSGHGVFAGPTVIEDEIRAQYGVHVLGRTEDVIERFYAITVQRRIQHPAVIAVCETARQRLFGGE